VSTFRSDTPPPPRAGAPKASWISQENDFRPLIWLPFKIKIVFLLQELQSRECDFRVAFVVT
jgi:hypothetical protein